MRKRLSRLNLEVHLYNKESFHREGMEKGSKIDYIVTTRGHQTQAQVKERLTSDHDMVVLEAEIATKLRKTPVKEMFYSRLLNDVKKEHLRPYLRYILETICAVMGDKEGLDRHKQERLLGKLQTKVPITVRNPSQQLYEVERKVNDLLKRKLPFREV